MQVLNRGESSSDLIARLVSKSLNVGIAGVKLIEVFDFHNVKIVQQLSGLLTVLCKNVDHFNLFFYILG